MANQLIGRYFLSFFFYFFMLDILRSIFLIHKTSLIAHWFILNRLLENVLSYLLHMIKPVKSHYILFLLMNVSFLFSNTFNYKNIIFNFSILSIYLFILFIEGLIIFKDLINLTGLLNSGLNGSNWVSFASLWAYVPIWLIFTLKIQDV